MLKIQVRKVPKKVLLVAMAYVLVAGAAGFATAHTTARAAAESKAARTNAPDLATRGSMHAVGWMAAGAHIEYAENGTGDYWTVNSAGDFCGGCGPSRGGSMNVPDGQSLDAFTVTYQSDGPGIGFSTVSALTPNAWPLKAGQQVTKVIKTGQGLVINGNNTHATYEVTSVNGETGETDARVPFLHGPELKLMGSSLRQDQLLNGTQEGSQLLVAVPANDGMPPAFLIIDVLSVTAVAK